jgi:glycosyltransferase involved in cell wall biosynthesis
MRLYYWIHHTGRYDRTTGVQRVVRSLASGLLDAGHDLVAVRWCPERETIVRAETPWLDGLARHSGPELTAQAAEGEPLHLSSIDSRLLEGSWLLLPEVPHAGAEGAPLLPVALDYARFYGLRTAAIFYDLIPLRQPGYEGIAAAHEHYVKTLVAADLVAAISGHAADDLRAWWADQGFEPAALPRVAAVPLAAELTGVRRVTDSIEPAPPVRFAMIGTVEPRKNQVEVMRAFERLRMRRPDLDLCLDVAGGIHEGVAEAVGEIAGREQHIKLLDYVDDDRARSLVAASHATVFMSLYEGFGLPIAESLWQGTPCLCSDHNPMAEIAEGGGCLMVPARDTFAIEVALERLADDPGLRERLRREAIARPLRTWREYADEVVDALEATPPLRQLVVVEGSRGLDSNAAVPDATVTRRFHWRPESTALLPGSRTAPESPSPWAGHLHGLPAVVSAESAGSQDELGEIVHAATRLGLRVALQAEPGTDVEIAARSDVALFDTHEQREAALSQALRVLPRTVGVRARLEVGGGDAAARVIRSLEGRLSVSRAPRALSRVYYWSGLTAEQPFNTGIQRVTRMLGAALQRAGVEVVPVGWDDAAGCMTVISETGLENLARWNGPRLSPVTELPDDLSGEWLLLPEITVPVVPPGSNVAEHAAALGMRCAAVFHDLIPEKTPESYPEAALEAMRAYWRMFASVDLALPVSWSVASDLVRWLDGEGLRIPRIVPCALAGGSSESPRATDPPVEVVGGQPLRLLAVGTWEPRKNFPALLRAVAGAQERAGRPLQLTIVGRRAGYEELDIEIERLAADGGVVLRGHVTDDELGGLYRGAAATVLASWEEGFGLPVLESLWHGRPSVCHDGSAMAELVPGGGVLAVDMRDERELEDALVALADDRELLERLGREAVVRPIRTWDEYADDVLRALTSCGSAPGWSLPAVVRRRPLLTCAVTTYNRARWLRHSLPRLLDATRDWRDVVEVVVCDNASTDDTADVVALFRRERNFATYRNPVNVGMLGSFGSTARASSGAFVWVLGDDDLITDGAIENVLEGLARHPDVEMAYLNYGYTQFDEPEELDDVDRLVAAATPIAEPGPNRYASELREVAALNENLFTSIYACAFRRDHALRAYQIDTRGTPFTSLATCVPSSVYALAALQDRPAWWVGDPALVVNMNVSWLRWALLWHLERMPDLFEEAERVGIDPDRLDDYRLKHLIEAELWVRTTYFEADEEIRGNFSMARFLERSKHLPEFRSNHLAGVRRAYADAWNAGRVVVDVVPPDELFGSYGL